jgi:hypothetical protein
VTVRERFELAPIAGVAYVAMLDPSGGSGRDSFTLAIAHRDPSGRAVLDLVREVRPPFSPEAVCQQFAHELKRYGVVATFSDAYAAQWPVEQFAKLGIVVQPCALSRSELYLELVPMVNSGGCELLDDARLIAQLSALERRTGTSGRDSVDHRRGQFDDRANAAAGALVLCCQAIGLRGRLPAAFSQCNNFEASAAKTCPLLYRGGAHFPTDPHCRKHCAGFQAAEPLYRQHVRAAMAAKQPPQPAALFVRERFEPNAFQHRLIYRQVQQWAAAMGI